MYISINMDKEDKDWLIHLYVSSVDYISRMR